MSVNTYLPRSEMMANWSYHLMRMSWKVTDVFHDPSKTLDEFHIQKGWQVIENNLAKIKDEKLVANIRKKIDIIKLGERDLYY